MLLCHYSILQSGVSWIKSFSKTPIRTHSSHILKWLNMIRSHECNSSLKTLERLCAMVDFPKFFFYYASAVEAAFFFFLCHFCISSKITNAFFDRTKREEERPGSQFSASVNGFLLFYPSFNR